MTKTEIHTLCLWKSFNTSGWPLFENPWELTKETRKVSKSRASGPIVATRPFSLRLVQRKLPSSHDWYRFPELFRRCLFHIHISSIKYIRWSQPLFEYWIVYIIVKQVNFEPKSPLYVCYRQNTLQQGVCILKKNKTKQKHEIFFKKPLINIITWPPSFALLTNERIIHSV